MVTAIVTVVIFLVMISLHEFGHFIFGKALGFNVLEYAIGFGPVIFKKQTKKTLYSFRIVPFGGFCRFAGEDERDNKEEGNFNEQPCWKRVIVLAAGAIFNVLLGFIIFCIIVSMQGSYYTNTIEKVVPGTYLAETDAQPGDKIIEINGRKIGMYQDVQLYTSEIVSEGEICMTVDRDGEEKEFNFKPSTEHIKVTYNDDGVVYEETLNGVTKTENYKYGTDVERVESMVGKTEEADRYLIGIQPHSEKVTAFNLLPQSYRMTKFVVKALYRSVWELITGKQSMDNLSGPVGIVKEVNTAVNSGSQSVLYVLELVALLTINLGIFNLLPLPALDGGRLLFVIIEWIRGKPVSAEKEGMVHTIGFMLLILLMIFVSFKDVTKLIFK